MTELDRALWNTLELLVEVAYNSSGQRVWGAAPIRLVTFDSLSGDEQMAGILLPVDAPISRDLLPKRVPFGTTELTLVHRIHPPAGWRYKGDDPNSPWLESVEGALTPSFSLWPWLRHLISAGEEQASPARDKHGRFPVHASPRFDAGLLHVPFLNEAVALLIDAARSLVSGTPLLTGVEGLVLPPAVVLSHDWDILVGTDFWTQLSRLVQVVRPPGDRAAPDFSRLRLIVRNIRRPRAEYFDDQIRLWRLQGEFGFRSVSYVLNGRGGRYGARSTLSVAQELVEFSPANSEIGVHYNYGSLDRPEELAVQLAEVESIAAAPIISGRAHYLKLDPTTDYKTLNSLGIRCDESMGWVGENAYRCGTAGVVATSEDSLLELPMTFSDATLWIEDGTPSCFSAMLAHVAAIGGLLTILVHPGAHDSAAKPEMAGVYRRVLTSLADLNARSLIPSDLVRMADSARSRWRMPSGQ